MIKLITILVTLLIPTFGYADFEDEIYKVLQAHQDLKRLEQSVDILKEVKKPEDIKDSLEILDRVYKDLYSPYNKQIDYKQNTNRCEWLIRPGTLEQYTMCVRGK